MPELDETYLLTRYHPCLLLENSFHMLDNLIECFLCTNQNNSTSCRTCKSCVLYKNNSNQNLLTLVEHNADELKSIIEFVSKRSNVLRVVVINLDKIKHNNGNILLKILEEPPKNCKFILLTSNISNILPTIKSRCFIFQNFQTVSLPNNDVLESDEINVIMSCFLKPSIENIFNMSSIANKNNINNILDMLSNYIFNLTGYFYGQENLLEYKSEIDKLIPRLNIQKLFNYYDFVLELQSFSGSSLNHKLQLENCLLQYQQIYVK